jgi:hypothetical protein
VAVGAKSSSSSSGSSGTFGGDGFGGFVGDEKSGKGSVALNELCCVADLRGDCFICVCFGVVFVKKSAKRSTWVFAAVLARDFIWINLTF